MKTKLMAAIALAFISATCLNAKEIKNDKQNVTFHVHMHCESCKQKIEKNIAFEKGVTDMEVNLKNHTVKITFKTAKNTAEGLQQAFEKLGYKAELEIPVHEKQACDSISPTHKTDE